MKTAPEKKVIRRPHLAFRLCVSLLALRTNSSSERRQTKSFFVHPQISILPSFMYYETDVSVDELPIELFDIFRSSASGVSVMKVSVQDTDCEVDLDLLFPLPGKFKGTRCLGSGELFDGKCLKLFITKTLWLERYWLER